MFFWSIINEGNLFTKYKVKNPVGKILLPKPLNFVSDIFWPDSKRDVGINYAFRSDRAHPPKYFQYLLSFDEKVE